MSTRRWVALALVFLFVGIVAAVIARNSMSGGSLPSGSIKLTDIERPLPQFELKGLSQTSWSTETLAGKPWVINFWATWCVPCVEEIPAMNAAYDILEPQGIGMLAVNMGEGLEVINDFMQKIPIEFPVVLGVSDTLKQWSITGLPTTFIVNASGQLVYMAQGERDWDNPQLLQRLVDELVVVQSDHN